MRMRDWSSDVCSSDLPIIKDVLAVRFAGDVVRRDGFTKSLSTGQKQDQRHREGYRLGINFTPTDWLTNYTLLQHIHLHEVPSICVLTVLKPNFPLFNKTPLAGPDYFVVEGLFTNIA